MLVDIGAYIHVKVIPLGHCTGCGYSKQVFNRLHPFLACSDGMNFFT